MKNERYEASFKAEAVKLALSTDQSYADLARDLGVKYSTLHNWIYKSMNEPKTATKSLKQSQESSNKNVSKSDDQSLERELKAARKELELRKKEIEILKKAAAYFASQS
jgi:transposase